MGKIVGFVLVAFIIVFAIWVFNNQNPKIGFVDSNKIIEGFNKTKKARSEFKLKSDTWEASIDTLYKQLTLEIQYFEKNRGHYSSKEKKDKELYLLTRKKEFEKYKLAINDKAKKVEEQLMRDLVKEIDEYITSFGKKNNYDIILGANNSGNIVFAGEKLDLTSVILNGLNGEVD